MRPEDRLWNDFIFGVHQRSTRALDDGEHESWRHAAEQFYGEEKYKAIYGTYIEHLTRI